MGGVSINIISSNGKYGEISSIVCLPFLKGVGIRERVMMTTRGEREKEVNKKKRGKKKKSGVGKGIIVMYLGGDKRASKQ